jgi:hypothetical protein
MGSLKPHMNQSLYMLPLDTLLINMYANSIQWKLPSTTWEKLMRNESEKLKYQIPHHIHGAPNRGLNGIESIQWR